MGVHITTRDSRSAVVESPLLPPAMAGEREKVRPGWESLMALTEPSLKSSRGLQLPGLALQSCQGRQTYS